MTHGCSGSASPGAAVELVAVGRMDQHLTARPEVSLFRTRTYRHGNFAHEFVETTPNGQVVLGGEVQFHLNRTGDGFAQSYIRILLPAIKGVLAESINSQACKGQFPSCNPCDPAGDGQETTCCGDVGVDPDLDCELDNDCPDIDTCTGVSGPWASWVNAIGFAMLDQVCLLVGGSVLDEAFSWTMFMWEELCQKPGKQVRGEMVGRFFHAASLIEFSAEPQELFVPLESFFHMSTTGNMFPLTAAQWHNVMISVRTKRLEDLIQVSGDDVCVIKCLDGQPITKTDVTMTLLSNNIYLDVHERDKLSGATFKQLMRQTQAREFHHRGGTDVNLRLSANFAVYDIIFAVRRQAHEECNQWFNFCGKYGKDPVSTFQLKLNNQARTQAFSGRFYRLVQPHSFYNLIPESCIYALSFATAPADPSQPTGSVNMSRIENIEACLQLQSDLSDEQVSILIMARNWNILQFHDGLSGLGFSN